MGDGGRRTGDVGGLVVVVDAEALGDSGLRTGDVGVLVVGVFVGDAKALGEGGLRTGERDDELEDDVDRRRVGDLKKVTSFVVNKIGRVQF